MNAEPVAARRAARRAGLAAVVAAALLSAGCAAGQHAQTADEKTTLDGTNASVGDMDLRGLAIQAPTGNFYAKGSGALLTVVLVNNGAKADSLTSVTSSAITGWSSFATLAAAQIAQSATSSSGPQGSETVPVAPNDRTPFGTPEAKGGLLLRGLTEQLRPGQAISLTFSFARAGMVKVTVPVALSPSPASSYVPGPSAAGQEP
ncbi:hypothetical protein [uncultured Jatrophihabitans sp.]|uniref:hypothetical protein n=1 Tax=uncultured Jatrophihabitans sp. TaxID=1610747 RepID=UPI0035CAA966